MWMIRCAAGALVHAGVAQSEITSLRALVYPTERARTIMRFFLERVRSGEPSPMGGRVAQTLLLLARDHCRMPRGSSKSRGSR